MSATNNSLPIKLVNEIVHLTDVNIFLTKQNKSIATIIMLIAQTLDNNFDIILAIARNENYIINTSSKTTILGLMRQLY